MTLRLIFLALDAAVCGVCIVYQSWGTGGERSNDLHSIEHVMWRA